MEIPVIDIGGFDSDVPSQRRDVMRQWDAAFRSVGFATIGGHGVPQAVVDAAYAATRQFFDQPRDLKMRYYDDGMNERGYQPPGQETLGKTSGVEMPPDLVEAMTVAQVEWERRPPTHDFDRKRSRPNIWPDTPAGFRPAIEAYTMHVYALAQKLMRISAAALDLPEDYFGPMYDRMKNSLRLAQYPDQPEAPLSGQLRQGPHTDFGGFTILRQDEAPGGLQVLCGEWTDVRPIPGTFVINAGDMLQRWTNDRWRSNLHRVINPPRHLTGSTRRISLVYFTGPNHDLEIACLPSCTGPDRPAKYQPILAHEHFAQQLRATYSLQAS